MEGRAGGRFTEWAYTLLRIVVGFLFFCHGAQKVLGWFTEPGGQRMALAFPQLPWFAGWIETVGGVLIMLGFLTHLVAFLCSGEMAVAYFMAHAPHGFIPLLNHGELAAVYSFVFLYFAARGAGPYSVDGAIGRRRP